MRAVLLLCLVAAACAAVPKAPWDVPSEWAEPVYSEMTDPSFAEMDEMIPGSSQSGSSNPTPIVSGGEPFPPPGAIASGIPGPWLGSFATRMDSLSPGVPPYAFDATYARVGPYRPLLNKFSDGSSYPLDMQKFDEFPMDANGNPLAPQGSGLVPAAAGF